MVAPDGSGAMPDVKGLAALIFFAIQNGTSAVLQQYIMQYLPYVSPKSGMLVQEGIVKFPISLVLYTIECGGVYAMLKDLRSATLRDPMSWVRLWVPSLLWTIGAMLQGYGNQHLDAPIAQLVFQAKIPFTAAVSMALLGTRFTRLQWLSLCLLSFGIVLVGDFHEMLLLVQKKLGLSAEHAVHALDLSALRSNATLVHVHQNGHHHHQKHYHRNANATELGATAVPGLAAHLATGRRMLFDVGPQLRPRNPAMGVAQYLLASLCSAFASVYLEKMVKQRVSDTDAAPPSLWLRNIQLSLPATVICATVLLADVELRKDPFRNFTPFIIFCCYYSGMGGMLVALVLRYANSVLRGFSAAASTIIATICSALFLEFRPSSSFLFGALTVLGSMYLYSRDMSGAPANPQPTTLKVALSPADCEEEEEVYGDPPSEENTSSQAALLAKNEAKRPTKPAK